jgi:hypothetical protein
MCSTMLSCCYTQAGHSLFCSKEAAKGNSAVWTGVHHRWLWFITGVCLQYVCLSCSICCCVSDIQISVCAEREGKSAYSLMEGLGNRRLQQAKVRMHVQSLLVQSCTAIYTKSLTLMPDSALCTLVAALSEICSHTRRVRRLCMFVTWRDIMYLLIIVSSVEQRVMRTAHILSVRVHSRACARIASTSTTKGLLLPAGLWHA